MSASSGEEVYIVGGRIWRSLLCDILLQICLSCGNVDSSGADQEYLIAQIKATTKIEVRTDFSVAEV